MKNSPKNESKTHDKPKAYKKQERSSLESSQYKLPRWRPEQIRSVVPVRLVHTDIEYRTSFSGRKNDELPLERDLSPDYIRPKNLVYNSVPVYTLYKKKVDKVRPVAVSESDRSVPTGYPDWQQIYLDKYYITYRAPDKKSRFDSLLKPRIATIARGSRLTPEYKEKLLVGKNVLPAELELFREMLFKRKGVLV